jgi:tetratricopeptide (TPR) repeat protein
LYQFLQNAIFIPTICLAQSKKISTFAPLFFKKTVMRYFIVLVCMLPCVVWALPKERTDIRAGNKDYKKGNYAAAEIDYRRALDKVPESANAKYNLSNALLKQIDTLALQNPDESLKKQLGDIRAYYTPMAETSANAKSRADAHFNIGNTYLFEQDWKNAVEAYKKALRLNPQDVAAKENLVFAQAMSQNPPPPQQQQQNDKDCDNNENKDNKDDQDKQNDKNDKQDNQQQPNQDDKQQDKKQQEQQSNISKDDAQRMLQAIEQQEKNTQDKVKKEKAQKVRTRTSDKNW